MELISLINHFHDFYVAFELSYICRFKQLLFYPLKYNMSPNIHPKVDLITPKISYIRNKSKVNMTERRQNDQ